MTTIVQTPAKLFEDAKKHTGTLDTGCKVLTNGVKAWKELNSESVPAGITALSSQCGIFSGIAGALNLGSRAYEWVSPSVRKDWTWQKYTAQSGLTVANLFEAMLYGHKVGLWALGAAATPLEIAKNIILLPVSFFNTWNSVNEIIKAGDTLKHYQIKEKKWVAIKAALTDDPAAFLADGIDARIAAIKSKKTRLNRERDQAELKSGKPLAGKKLNDYTTQLSKLKARKNKWIQVRTKSDPTVYLDGVCDTKVNGYKNVVDAAKHNKGKIQTKNWLATINSVMKFVLGFIALGLLFAGVGIPVVAAAMAIAWAVTHIIGLAKDLYDMQPENKPKDLRALVPSFA